MKMNIIATILGAISLFAACKNGGNTRGTTSANQLSAAVVGEALPSFTLINDKGESISTESLKGKTVFVNLWATWCPPCVAEMPGIESLYSQTGNEQNAFVLISLDDDFETAKAWMAKKGFKTPIYYTRELPELFQVGSIPTTFIFDKNGKIVFKAVGGDNYNTPRFQKLMKG